MYKQSNDYKKLFLKEKMNGTAFYTRVWFPPSKNSRYIKLGDRTDTFNEEQAHKKILFIQEQFKKKKYDYQVFLKTYGKVINDKKEYTLNEIAKLYFESITARMRSDFIDKYKDRFNLKDKKTVDENQVYKNKLKAHKRMEAYYDNHFRVKVWNLKQEYTREKKAKKRLTKISVKEEFKAPTKKINDIKLDEVIEMIDNVKANINISQKTKHNLISLLKTIFIFAKRHNNLEHNHFDDIDNRIITKNPHNYRKRILDIPEMEELFKELYKHDFMYDKPNIFRASLLALSCGARANSVLNLIKSDFKLKENMRKENFIDAYYSIEIINFKTQDKYEIPLVEEVGRYFYYVLKDYEEDEYIIRHSQKHRRELKPFSEMPKEFLWTCKITVNANEIIKQLNEWVEKDELRIDQLEEHSHIKGIKEKIKEHKEQKTRNIKAIEEAHKKKYKSHEEYLARNFSFHSFRHQLVSLASVINPLYAKRILNHSSDRKDATTDKYIKTELPNVKKVLETALNPYLTFLNKIIKKEQTKRNTNIEKERSLFQSNINTDSFLAKEEAKRINRNKEEIYKNEEILFSIIEDSKLTNEEREKAIDYFNKYGEFDEKYL